MNSTLLTLKTSIIVEAPVAEVWDALTNPEMVKKYFFGSQMITTWKEGESIRFTGEWEGQTYEDKGTVLSFKPAHYLAYSYWSSMAGTPNLPQNYAQIEYYVEPLENGTQVSVTQDSIKDETAQYHSENQWQLVLGEMKKLLEK